MWSSTERLIAQDALLSIIKSKYGKRSFRAKQKIKIEILYFVMAFYAIKDPTLGLLDKKKKQSDIIKSK